jgi:hypothetical protein
MRPSLYHVASTIEEDRHRHEERRHAIRRALLDAEGEHPSPRARLAAALLNLTRRDDHSLTNYPCRLADGRIGRVAVVQSGADWTMVCRIA